VHGAVPVRAIADSRAASAVAVQAVQGGARAAAQRPEIVEDARIGAYEGMPEPAVGHATPDHEAIGADGKAVGNSLTGERAQVLNPGCGSPPEDVAPTGDHAPAHDGVAVAAGRVGQGA